jgi:hypothetical protein
VNIFPECVCISLAYLLLNLIINYVIGRICDAFWVVGVATRNMPLLCLGD